MKRSLASLASARCCRFCRCTEDDPCTLVTNEACVLNVITLCCNNPGCLVALGQMRRRVSRQVREEIARMVGPIAQKFIQQRRREREAAKTRSRNRKSRRRNA